jgi:hypothetical protein
VPTKLLFGGASLWNHRHWHVRPYPLRGRVHFHRQLLPSTRNPELHLVLDILRWDVYYSARNMAMVALVYSPPNWPLTSERSQFDESNIRAYSYFAIMLGRSMIFCSFCRVDEFAAQLEICTATLS